jgi:hypothetical protein
MGAGEVGRELGDAGGPLLVAALASIAGLGAGLLGLAVGLLVLAGHARPTTGGFSRISGKPLCHRQHPTQRICESSRAVYGDRCQASASGTPP